MLWFLGASRLAIITTYLKILTLLHWLHYGFHYEIGVPTFFAVGCSRVILQLEGLILTYPFGHELCKEEHRNDSSPLSSSWFSISNWANTWERTFHAIRTFLTQPSCLNLSKIPISCRSTHKAHFWRENSISTILKFGRIWFFELKLSLSWVGNFVGLARKFKVFCMIGENWNDLVV